MSWLKHGRTTLISVALSGVVIANAGAQPAAKPSEPAQRAPGQFEIDPKAAERALERTLIQRGGLLLPAGQMEIEPSFAYTRSERGTPGEVFAVGNQAIASTDKLRRSVFDVDVQLRLGLKFDSQLELRIPFRHVDQSRVTQLSSSPLSEQSATGSGFGDIRVGFAKTLLREARWWPDLVARLAWNSGSGRARDADVSLGGGFDEISATLSAVKRQDPLAFIAALAYQTTFEKNDIEPGQQIRFVIGTALAASPETSLRLVFDHTSVRKTKIAGSVVSGSDQAVGVASFGASSLVGRSTLLDVSLDMGLNNEAPDYSVRVSVGKRFTLF
jgi:Putative MetA-pathway of phenol degradation